MPPAGRAAYRIAAGQKEKRMETHILVVEDDAEIRDCIVALMTTDAGTGFMHESFSRHDAADFTRAWFAWQNTLFGELILKLVNDGKTDLLNSIY